MVNSDSSQNFTILQIAQKDIPTMELLEWVAAKKVGW